MFATLCCTCTTGFSAEAGNGQSVLEMRRGKGAKADLEGILMRTVAIRLYGVDLSSPSKNSARLIEREKVDSIVKILWEDCYEVDWVKGGVFYFVEPSVLELPDIEGKVVWRVGGKTVFKYQGVRYTSLEQLKEHADLSKEVVVHLMGKTVSDDIRRFYKDLQEQGFKVEDMTVPHSNGPGLVAVCCQ